jgi:hypothetical protein
MKMSGLERIILFYVAMDGHSSTSTQVVSAVRLAISNDGIHFASNGEVLSPGDESVWGYVDELFPVGIFCTKDKWFVYCITKSQRTPWDLGLAWGPSPYTLTNAVDGLTAGSYVIGGCDPVRFKSDQIALFIARDFKKYNLEVRVSSTDTPHVLSEPLKSYRFNGFSHATVFLDNETNTWFIYQMPTSGRSIRVRTAPAMF